MLAINLLDWRSKNILILNRRFAAMVAAAIVSWLIIAFFIFLIIQNQIKQANDDDAYLDNQLKSVAGALVQIKDLTAQKDLLMSRRNLIESLQANRALVVDIFDNIARAMPEGVILTEISRKDNAIIITGTGGSNYDISVLLENVQHLPWVQNANLGELKTNAANQSGKEAVKAATTATEQISFTLNITINAANAGVNDATTGY